MIATTRRVLLTILLVAGVPMTLLAQAGRVTGRVLDAAGALPLGGATVELEIAGVSRTVQTGIDGRFQFPNVPAGTMTLRARMIGYTGKTVTGVTLAAGAVASQDIMLAAQTVQLEEVVVHAAVERGTVADALANQRNNVNVVNSVTAQEIARSPDGDAAAVVQRVSGVTVQEGKFVFVRGLGERYTTTSLNGARIPSPEPERKVVPLDLFPSGILQTITTAKTFTPDLSGDFSGAQVDIQTREFPAERTMSLAISAGANSASTGVSMPRAPRAGSEQFTFGSGNRQLPAEIAAAGNFEPTPTQSQVNALVRTFRNSWSARSGTGAPSSGMSLALGGSDPILGQRIGYLISGSYGLSQDIRAKERRAVALATDDPAVQREVDRYEGTTGRSSAMLGGLVNLSTLVGASSRLALNSTYSRTADNDARREVGQSENLGGQFQIDRLQYVERVVWSTQLLGEHDLGRRHRFDWSANYSDVTRREPDRSEIVYALDTDPQGNPLPPTWFSASNEGAVRTFGDLTESSHELLGSYRLNLGEPSRGTYVKVGGALRRTERASINRVYGVASTLPRSARELSPEEIFDGRFMGEGDAWFRITPLGAGGSYDAVETIRAGYAMVQLPLTRSLELVGGARYEHSGTEVKAAPTVGAPVQAKPEYSDILPSVALTLRLGENHVLRASATQTLSRPEYRELAPIQYREVIGGENVIGNPDLVRALIQNYDFRWEWYPRATEVVSIGLFAKTFDRPIERVYLATSGTRVVTFVNAASARNYGVELELRKSLDLVGEGLRNFGFFANGTLMHSEITIGDGAASKLNDRRAMVGQAPYVINAGLTFTSPSGSISATALYNVVGARIVSASEAPLPDTFEEPRHGLDLALRFPVLPGVSGKADLRNLLDSPTQIRQGTVIRESYYSGRTLSVGLSWQPGRP